MTQEEFISKLSESAAESSILETLIEEWKSAVLEKPNPGDELDQFTNKRLELEARKFEIKKRGETFYVNIIGLLKEYFNQPNQLQNETV